jgi:hypothetical protein
MAAQKATYAVPYINDITGKEHTLHVRAISPRQAQKSAARVLRFKNVTIIRNRISTINNAKRSA